MERSPESQVRLDRLMNRDAVEGNVLRGTTKTREPLGEKEVVCGDHGAYVSTGTKYMGFREIWTPCPDCEEARLARERQLDAQQRAERAAARLQASIGEAAIPARFVGRSLENFIATTEGQERALGIAQDYLENFDAHAKRGAGLILSGLPGTGKSHLATAILQALMPEKVGLYITCMSVIRMVRGTWRKDSEQSEAQVLDLLGGVPLLVLDEIGVQYGTDGEQTILFDVLDRRYRDMQPTIFLTNQDAKGLAQFIGERTFDRLREVSRWVAFDWESYRPQARKASA